MVNKSPHGLYFHMRIQQLESLKNVNWVLRYLEGIESYIRLHSLFLLLVGGGGGRGQRIFLKWTKVLKTPPTTSYRFFDNPTSLPKEKIDNLPHPVLTKKVKTNMGYMMKWWQPSKLKSLLGRNLATSSSGLGGLLYKSSRQLQNFRGHGD